MWILSTALLLGLMFYGVRITYAFRLKLLFEERLAAGFVIGMISLGYVMLGLSYVFGLNVFSLLLFSGLIALVAIFNFTPKNYAFVKLDFMEFVERAKKFEWRVFILTLFYFFFILGYLAGYLLIFRNSSYYVQPLHSYGDISLHLGIISNFAFGNNFPVINPIFAGGPISYPFLFDFITAIFVNPLGFPLDQAIALTGILMMAAIIVLAGYLIYFLTKSKLASLLFLMLFLFNGGFGFVHFFIDYKESGLPFLNFIMSLSKDYTALKDIGYWWINVVISMLLPQRGFLLGLPAALIIIRIFWQLSEKFDIKLYVLGILLVSLLPIIHAHTLIALFPILLWLTILMIKKRMRNMPWILILGLLGAGFALFLSKLFLAQSGNPLELIHFQIGWMKGQENLLTFYIKNFGLMLFLMPVSIFFAIKRNFKLAILTIIGQVWIILPSAFRFQPWDFDNSKLFIYWYIFSAFSVAPFLSYLFKTRKAVLICVAAAVLFFSTLSGMLDIFRLFSSSGTQYQVYSPQAIRLAEFVKNNTPRTAVFLSVDKFDNPVIALAGRKTVVGYHGWLWTYGLDYSKRDADVRLMLSGKGNNELLQKYNISYVILFPDQTDYVINQDFFERNFKLIYNKEGYKIFQL